MSAARVRPAELRRSLLFVGGADATAHQAALEARPDVLIQDLEDFTPPGLKQAARDLSADLFARARAAGVIPAVRINLLDDQGRDDLAAVMPAGPALVLLPKAETGLQIAALAEEIGRLETAGGVEIVPTVETALGVYNLRELKRAGPRVRSFLLGVEDLAADLMAERSPEGGELAYARQRFLLECRALGVEPVDAPYTYSDAEGCEREARRSRRLGYRSKAAVRAEHVAALHVALTPSAEEIAAARAMIEGFETARAKGEDRALVAGQWVEPPTYRTAQRLVERARLLGVMGEDGAA